MKSSRCGFEVCKLRLLSEGVLEKTNAICTLMKQKQNEESEILLDTDDYFCYLPRDIFIFLLT